MVNTINTRVKEIGNGVAGVDYKIAGFAWFQGWSDAEKGGGWVEHEYEQNMADLITDVRAEFKEPTLPFIIAGPGMDGYGSRGKSNILNAQRRVADRPELNESTIYVESRIFAAKYSCLEMDDAICLRDGVGLSDAGCDGEDKRGGCACNDIIRGLEAALPDSKRKCGGKVNGDQGQHWAWNARSYFKVGQKMGEVTLTPTLTLTLTLTLNLNLSLTLTSTLALTRCGRRCWASRCCAPPPPS